MTLRKKITGETPEVHSAKRKPREDRHTKHRQTQTVTDSHRHGETPEVHSAKRKPREDRQTDTDSRRQTQTVTDSQSALNSRKEKLYILAKILKI